MKTTVARRIGVVLLTLVVSSFVVFAALSLAPGGPAQVLSAGKPLSPQALAALQEEFHLNDPFFVRYFHWVADAVTGEFGTSTVFHAKVGSLILPRLGTTAWLLAYASILTLLFGVGLGIIGGLGGRMTQTAITVVTSFGMAVPAFVAAVVLTAVFAVKLGWFPVSGGGSGLLGRLEHLTLPAVALAVAGVAYVARITRTAVSEEALRDHVTTAVVRGIPSRLVVRRHILRNAAIPIATVSGITVAGLLAGTVVVESAFQVGGIGLLLIQAVERRDFAVVQAICLIIVIAFVLVNTIVDSAYSALDPRVR